MNDYMQYIQTGSWCHIYSKMSLYEQDAGWMNLFINYKIKNNWDKS